MVADPCGSTLVPGVYGTSEGLLSRSKTTYRPSAAAGNTCGYVLWCPDYANSGTLGTIPDEDPGTATFGNLFLWTSNDPATAPTNVFGLNVLGLQEGSYLPDPAYSFLNSDIVEDGRVLSACLQLTYFGKMLDSSGEIGFISNLPADTLTKGGSDNSPSVDELMQYVNHKQRFGTDTYENVYRPNELSSNHFRSTEEAMWQSRKSTDITGNFFPTTVTRQAEALSPRVFGFVWRGIQADAPIVLDFTKSYEWRARPGSGLVQTPMLTEGPSLIPHINRVIDRHEQRTGNLIWNRVKSTVESIGSKISQIALSGVSGGALGFGKKLLMNHARGMFGGLLGGEFLPALEAVAAPLMIL